MKKEEKKTNNDGVWSDGVAVYTYYKATAIYNKTYLEQRTLVRFAFLGLLVLDLCVYFVDRCLFFFFLPLCCVSFDLRIQITLLVSSNSSSYQSKRSEKRKSLCNSHHFFVIKWVRLLFDARIRLTPVHRFIYNNT